MPAGLGFRQRQRHFLLDLIAPTEALQDLCPRILHGPEVSVLFHGPDFWSGILHNLCWGILYGPDLCPRILHGLYDQCLRIFVGRPSLELPEQGFR